MNRRPFRPAYGRRTVRGLSLVELMVSLVLGLLVVAGALSIFDSNRQTYVATESLGRVQENARVAFELMARDIREAGGNPCGRNLPMANLLKNPTTRWYTNFTDGIRGVDGAFQDNPPNRVPNTDAIELMYGSSTGATVTAHVATSARFAVNTASHGLVADDLVIACDFRQASLFQMTGPSATNNNVVHNTGNGVGSIGNCSKGLGFKVPVDCSTNGTPYTFGPNSMLVKLKAGRWYVGTNTSGQRVLYYSTLRNDGGTLTITNDEVATGVDNMQITYLVAGQASYIDATAVGTRWKDVLAVRIEITLKGDDRIAEGKLLERKLVHVASLRNRNL